MLSQLTPVPSEQVRLLLVEPHEDCAAELRALLSSVLAGRCVVDLVTSGEQAVDLLRGAEYHIVLGEAELPGMSGVELFRQVRPLQPDAVRVLLAHSLDRARLLDAINTARVYGFLARPWTAVELDRALRNALAWRHNGRAMRLLLEEQRRAHMALLQSLSALERTQRQMIHVERLATVGRLASGIVHEVRNQLTGLTGIFSTLRHGEGESAALADAGYRVVKELTGHLRSIQAFARASGWAYEMAEVSVAEVLEQVQVLHELETGTGGLVLGAHPDVQALRLRVDTPKLAHALLAVAREGHDCWGDPIRLRAEAEPAGAVTFSFSGAASARPPARGSGRAENDPLRAVASMIVEGHGGELLIGDRCPGGEGFAVIRIPRGGAT